MLAIAGGCIGPAPADAFKGVLAPVAQEAVSIGDIDINERATTAVRVNANPLGSFVDFMVLLFLYGLLLGKAGLAVGTFNDLNKIFSAPG